MILSSRAKHCMRDRVVSSRETSKLPLQLEFSPVLTLMLLLRRHEMSAGIGGWEFMLYSTDVDGGPHRNVRVRDDSLRDRHCL